MFAADSLRMALRTLGELLADRGLDVEIVVIGGGALLLANLIERPTKDLDALALVQDGEYQLAQPLPVRLKEAIADVAVLLELDANWLNPGPTAQLTQGLPQGFRDRTNPAVFGGLTIQIAGRFDQVCLKLYAAADSDRESKHVRDLAQLNPTADELREASSWVKSQDTSPAFAEFVDQVIEHIAGGHGG